MRLIACMLMLTLAGCHNARPDPPPAQVIKVPVKVYVPIKPALTARCTWPKSGKPSQAIEVAKKRGDCLKRYELQLDGIEKVQGAAVEDADER